MTRDHRCSASRVSPAAAGAEEEKAARAAGAAGRAPCARHDVRDAPPQPRPPRGEGSSGGRQRAFASCEQNRWRRAEALLKIATLGEGSGGWRWEGGGEAGPGARSGGGWAGPDPRRERRRPAGRGGAGLGAEGRGAHLGSRLRLGEGRAGVWRTRRAFWGGAEQSEGLGQRFFPGEGPCA